MRREITANVVRDPKFLARFWSKVDKSGDCWVWIGDRGGQPLKPYGRITLNYVHMRAHRVAWVIANGEIPDGLLVCHHCDFRLCVNPSHLFIGTNSDNMLDCSRKGRLIPGGARGERNNSSKLCESTVRNIRSAAAKGEAHTVIARSLGVDSSTIDRVVSRKSWRHVS